MPSSTKIERDGETGNCARSRAPLLLFRFYELLRFTVRDRQFNITADIVEVNNGSRRFRGQLLR